MYLCFSISKMDEKLVLRLPRPIKVPKDTCVTCGVKQWKRFNSIYSTRSKIKEIPMFLKYYCHVNITQGGMCTSCEQTVQKLSKKIKQFRDTCHEALTKNNYLSKDSLLVRGIQNEGNSSKNKFYWPGKENLFVALSVCSNLPSALHHTISTENVPNILNAEENIHDATKCKNGHSSGHIKGSVCVKAECLAKPALVPLNQKTVLSLARLSAIKIGEMMGTAFLGSATMHRQTTPKYRTLNPESSKDESINTKNIDDCEKSKERTCIHLKEILKETDWLYRNDKEDGVETNDKNKKCLKKRKNPNNDNCQLKPKSQPKKKQIKFVKENIVASNTKDILFWESTWRKNNANVYYACPHRNCSEMLVAFERDVHTKTHRVDSDGFACTECDVELGKWDAMREHLRCSHSLPQQLYNCDQGGCNDTFNSFKELRKHMLHTHNFESSLQTDKNAKKAPDKNNLGNEEISLDEMPKIELCSICGMACKSQDLLTHEAKHTVPDCLQLKCLACNSLFHANQIKDHVLVMHRKLTYRYRCESCGFASQSSAGLQRHMGIKHANAIVLVCDKCGKGFKTAAALNVHHKRVHVTEDEKTLLCSMCGYLCAHETLLKEHVRKVHTKPSWRRFKCPLCEHFSLRESSLERHIQMYHNHSDRQFKCSYCLYASKTKANLIRHEVTHKPVQNSEPFSCFQSSKKETFQNHILTNHPEEIPYSGNTLSATTFNDQTFESHITSDQHNCNNQILQRIVADEQRDRLYFQL